MLKYTAFNDDSDGVFGNQQIRGRVEIFGTHNGSE